MEDSVPTRKHGRLRKITSIDADRLRSMNGVCRCGTLMQAKQGPRSVWEYTEEFMETAKRCKPKLTEDWCRWYKAGLREEIQGKLLGVLEPWEFALVNRMAGQAMKAKMALTVGSSPSRALRRKWMWKMICGRHRLWMKEPREDVPSRASGHSRRAEWSHGIYGICLSGEDGREGVGSKGLVVKQVIMSRVMNQKRIHQKINNRRIMRNRQLEVPACLVRIRGGTRFSTL
ncbi:hypothetical protein YC2023_081529 [Brassica napus]